MIDTQEHYSSPTKQISVLNGNRNHIFWIEIWSVDNVFVQKFYESKLPFMMNVPPNKINFQKFYFYVKCFCLRLCAQEIIVGKVFTSKTETFWDMKFKTHQNVVQLLPTSGTFFFQKLSEEWNIFQKPLSSNCVIDTLWYLDKSGCLFSILCELHARFDGRLHRISTLTSRLLFDSDIDKCCIISALDPVRNHYISTHLQDFLWTDLHRREKFKLKLISVLKFTHHFVVKQKLSQCYCQIWSYWLL